MKSFFQFLGEAETQAASQAKKLGLKGDGHGETKFKTTGLTVLASSSLKLLMGS